MKLKAGMTNEIGVGRSRCGNGIFVILTCLSRLLLNRRGTAHQVYLGWGQSHLSSAVYRQHATDSGAANRGAERGRDFDQPAASASP